MPKGHFVCIVCVESAFLGGTLCAYYMVSACRGGTLNAFQPGIRMFGGHFVCMFMWIRMSGVHFVHVVHFVYISARNLHVRGALGMPRRIAIQKVSEDESGYWDVQVLSNLMFT